MQKHVEGFRLSPQQARFWLLKGQNPADQLSQSAIHVEGSLDVETLKRALQEIVARHDILRTDFYSQPGVKVPLQIIAEDGKPEWRIVARENFDVEDATALDELLREERERPFNAECESRLRFTLVKLDDGNHLLLAGLPTLCADAQTLNNLVDELVRFYAPSAGETETPTQYVQFSEWQNDLLEGEDASAGRDFWRRQRASDHLILPHEGRAQLQPFAAHASVELTIPSHALSRLESLARAHETSSETCLLACWELLLSRLSTRAEVSVNVLYDCRKYEELQEAFGLFARFLAVHCRFEKGLTFEQIIRRVEQSLREARDWQEYAISEADEESAADYSSNPPVSFEYARLEVRRADGLAFTTRRQHVDFDPSKLKLSCVQTGEAVVTAFVYDPRAFSSEGIRRLAQQFHRLLESVVNEPQRAAGQLALLGDEEREHLLHRLNETERTYPKELCFHQLFEAQAVRTPDARAVTCADECLSYRELNERANQLAHYLQRLGVGPEARVGICVERSVEMVVGLLGILKAGGAYVPLDAHGPRARLALMIEDAQPHLLLTQQRLTDLPSATGARTLCIDAEWPQIAREGTGNPTSGATPQNVAYVIYTSGSTGMPKGVMIHHQGLVNYLSWCTEAYRVAEGNGALVHSPIGFDLTVTGLFSPLLAGRCVALLPEDGGLDTLS